MKGHRSWLTGIISFLSWKNKYSELEKKYSELEKSFQLRRREFDALQTEHADVSARKEAIQTSLDDVSAQNKILEDEKSNIEAALGELTKKHQDLTEKHHAALKQKAIFNDKMLAGASEIERLKNTPSFRLGFILMAPMRILKRAMQSLSGSGG